MLQRAGSVRRQQVATHGEDPLGGAFDEEGVAAVELPDAGGVTPLRLRGHLGHAGMPGPGLLGLKAQPQGRHQKGNLGGVPLGSQSPSGNVDVGLVSEDARQQGEIQGRPIVDGTGLVHCLRWRAPGAIGGPHLWTVIRFSVRVPVLSLPMVVVLPSVSTAGRWRTMARRRAMRRTPRARVMVKTTGSPSGMAATAMADSAANLALWSESV
jgi:hypothetical protein